MVPPVGKRPDAHKIQGWSQRITQLREALADSDSQLAVDVSVLIKASEYAIKFDEFYKKGDEKKVDRLLDLAALRLEALAKGKSDWSEARGCQVRGYRSSIDGSVQPLGIVAPDNLNPPAEGVPLYVWLHGRGDKTTDLHFIHERLDKKGTITPDGAIVVHPFGRQCIGYKSAGEVDVLDAIAFACENYPVDPKRVVLMGFSMGGAGVWHLAAHYSEHFIAASPGAGFAETAQYQQLRPENFPAEYVQMLWGIYDVPGYVRNLFNLPITAYSGENDKQIQAARVMEAAFLEEGRKLPHLIGPGMGHKYHPDTLKTLLDTMAVASRAPVTPTSSHIQSKHWRYASRAGVVIDGFKEQYADTRVDMQKRDGAWQLLTKNATRLRVTNKQFAETESITIDGDRLSFSPTETTLFERKPNAKWAAVESLPKLRKQPGLSGPIDDAFLEPFLVVLPSGSSQHAEINRWVQCEHELFRLRWESLFRGQLRTKLDTEVTQSDMDNYHLVLWGTPDSNTVLKKVIADCPISWDEQISIGGTDYSPQSHIPVFILPNPLQPAKYIVCNSGPTFRPAHDRTNSLQNPQLPDWAIIGDLDSRNAEFPGKIVRAGFFDDSWQPTSKLTW